MSKKILFAFFVLGTIFSCISPLHQDFDKKENQERLITLYKKYLDSVPGQPDMLGGLKKLLKPATLQKIIPQLDIDFSLQEIEDMYRETGFILLRKINPKFRTLVIGCGNRPFCSGGWDTVVCDERYRMEHVHGGAVTVDPDIRYNPTVIAYFGIRPLTIFADNAFDKILVEAIAFPSLLELKYFVSDITRLLSVQGKFYYDFGGYGPLRLHIKNFKKFAKQWDRDMEYLFEEAKERLSLLPVLFEKMLNDRGARAVKHVFAKLLKEGNWVCEGQTWEQTFSAINRKVSWRDSWVKGIIEWFWPTFFSFTIEESRLIRLSAMELDVN